MPYKVLTHEFKPPIRGGNPLCALRDLPITLPKVQLDTTSVECGAGWNYCDDIETALNISGLWPNGWSAMVVEVEPGDDAISRGKKCRASTLTITGVADDDLVRDAIQRFSIAFGSFSDDMAAEQWLWFEALRRPYRKPRSVEAGLNRALKSRGLGWSLKRFESARDAWTARDAWAARAAWAAWTARDAWAAWTARDAWAARAARDAWNAWDAWTAWTARAALTVHYAAKNQWTANSNHNLLSAGIRDAYRNGLAIAIPTGPNELGWVMAGKDERHPALEGAL